MPGPLFNVMTRVAVRRRLREQGKSLIESIRMADEATDDLIGSVQRQVAPDLPEDVEVARGLGDGKIIDAILEFLRSEQGKALIDALVRILLGLLVV
jgi:hypothetical protein